ncbi:hypothetical protein [Acidocella sp.]|uniref:hypothetical protein n=1 Tax=Acidocella sp. TaxID=50710 RepID=UPI002636F10A|nr:hypothetical protein [Acidocella sp.]
MLRRLNLVDGNREPQGLALPLVPSARTLATKRLPRRRHMKDTPMTEKTGQKQVFSNRRVLRQVRARTREAAEIV